MTLQKNILALLTTYLGFNLLELLCGQFIANNDFLYPILTILNLCLIIVLLSLNHHYQASNKIEQGIKINKLRLSLLILGTSIGLFIVQTFGLYFENIFLHQPAFSQNTNLLIAITQKYPYYLIVIVICAPICEELIFRKVLYGNLSDYFNIELCLVASSMLFSVAHGDGHYLTYWLIGMLLALCYRYSHTILAPILAHLIMNAIVLWLNFQ